MYINTYAKAQLSFLFVYISHQARDINKNKKESEAFVMFPDSASASPFTDELRDRPVQCARSVHEMDTTLPRPRLIHVLSP